MWLARGRSAAAEAGGCRGRGRRRPKRHSLQSGLPTPRAFVAMKLRTASSSELAIDGGKPVRTSPLPAWPKFAADEIASVVDVLRSGKVNYWTGSCVKAFEHAFAGAFEMPFAVAVANGTIALELALRALGVGPGAEVIVTPRSFIASVSAVISVGARPVFADVDRESGNITAASAACALTQKTRALLPVHLAGWPCDMLALLSLAREHGLIVIEDCAQAHGARLAGRPVGSFGDAAAFSFCQDKIMSTGGEGGMLLFRDEAAWRRAWEFKDHGKSYALTRAVHYQSGFRWLHESIGTNWRLTEMQAAIGLRQLAKLESWVTRRRALAHRLAHRLSELPALRVPHSGVRVHHAHYRLYAYVCSEALAPGWNRDRIAAAVAAEGVPCLVGTCPEIYRERAIVDRRLDPEVYLPIAHELGETSLAFLVHPTLGDDDIDDVAKAVEKVLAVASH